MIAEGINEPEVYGEFLELAREIKVPILQLHYGLELVKGGDVLEKRQRAISHSFNRNAYNWMFSQLAAHPLSDGTFGAGLISMKKTDGVITTNTNFAMYGKILSQVNATSSYYIDTAGIGYNAPVGVDYHGIVIGTGAGAEGFSDHKLGAQVAHGNGSGQMHYADTEESWAFNDGTDTMTSTYVRYFNNNSGGTIVLAEIGLYVRGMSNIYNYMVARDLLGATINCVDASQLKVTYEIDLVFPE